MPLRRALKSSSITAKTAAIQHAAFPVWDPHLRAAHALISLLFAGQFISGQFAPGPGWLHLWMGYALLAVLLFRLAWGFGGSQSARFSQFLPSPRQFAGYVSTLFSRRPGHWPGHNPVGALSTLLLLTLLLAQSLTGLFVETWGEWRGPLAERVSRETMRWMSDWHSLLLWPLLILVSVHLLAVLAYLLLKGEDRITPIFTSGRIALPENPQLAFATHRRAAVLWLMAILAVVAVAVFGPID